MRIGTAGFIPERLTEARAARRIPSMSALARALSLNPSTVSRWEDGSSSPDADALELLAGHLGTRQEFFLRPAFEAREPVFFRSLASALVRDLDYQRVQMRWLQEISNVVDHYTQLPLVDLPQALGGTQYRQLRDDDIERIAQDLRQRWGLGDGPCVDVLPVLERHGFIVSVIEMGTIKLDGLCSWSPVDGRPHILLASDKTSFPRRQMDAAHEMAHAVLHRNVSADDLKRDLKVIEGQAFRLASAFLMPSSSYPLAVSTPTLNAMLATKEKWRVSVKAQIRRLFDLDIIDQDYATHLHKLYSAKGWSREEPQDRRWLCSEPSLLRDALHLIVDSGVRTKDELLGLEFVVSAGDVENLAGLSPGWFGRGRAEVVQLKATAGSPGRAESAMVFDFPTPNRRRLD